MKETIKSLMGPMRPPFLILTPACVSLGVGTAIWTQGYVKPMYVFLVLIGALCTHISVNAFNEYFDFRSGLDSRTQRTPFSGGSGTLQSNPDLAGQALRTALVTFIVTALIGAFFMYTRGLAILPLGLIGLLVIFAYTPWLTKSPFLCLIAPGLGFGPLMVMGTHFALTGSYSWTAFIASLVPFFLVSDLLLLNQFPDVQADRAVGRRHIPIVMGTRAGSLVYGAFLLLTYVTILLASLGGLLPTTSLIGLITMALAIPAFVGSYRYAEEIPKLVRFMGLNVIVNILTPVLVAIGLVIA
jgi:1,4-dihydroxy-2-naphthoate octaprenyltransferase